MTEVFLNAIKFPAHEGKREKIPSTFVWSSVKSMSANKRIGIEKLFADLYSSGLYLYKDNAIEGSVFAEVYVYGTFFFRTFVQGGATKHFAVKQKGFSEKRGEEFSE